MYVHTWTCNLSFIVNTYLDLFWTFLSVLTLDFRPDGKELAVGTLNAQISFWDPINARQTGSIEGRHDLGYGRKETDKVTGKTLAAGKWVRNVLCYSAV